MVLAMPGTAVSNNSAASICNKYASPNPTASDSQRSFVEAFVAAWNKVMNADRFDLAA